MTWLEWYNTLEKPSWTPEASTFATMWQILYPIIAITFGYVFIQAFRKKVPWKVALPFAINIAANLLYTPIQFEMRSLLLAAIDVVIVWITIVWMIFVIWKHYEWVALAQLPYFIWISIAVVLQLTITAWNW